MSPHYFLTNGQSDASTFVLISAMQTLKYYKDPLCMLFFKSDAVVLNRKSPITVLLRHLDNNVRSGTGAKLDGIGNKILKDLGQLPFIAKHKRQLVTLYYTL